MVIPSPHISRIVCCDRGYDRPSGRPRVSDPATYYSSTPQVQLPAVSRWHGHLDGLATTIREISGLAEIDEHGSKTVLLIKLLLQ